MQNHILLDSFRNIIVVNMEVLPRPPYYHDFIPSDNHLFRSLQHFRWKNALTVKSLKMILTVYLIRRLNNFTPGVNKLRNRWYNKEHLLFSHLKITRLAFQLNILFKQKYLNTNSNDNLFQFRNTILKNNFLK